MKSLKLFALLTASSLILSCATISAPPPNNPDSRLILQQFSSNRGPKISVGTITSTQADLRAIQCRRVGKVSPPEGLTYAQYTEQLLIDQFTIAPGYDADAPLRLEGNIDRIDFDSINPGKWMIDMTFRAKGINSFTVSAEYHFSTSLDPNAACPQVGRALSPAMYDLLARLVTHPSFKQLIGYSN